MTRDEATEYLIDISYKFGNISVEYLTEKDGEKMREAINVLTNEQQTCKDAISRQAVVELVKDSYYDLRSSMEDTWAMVEDVERLPSVNPQHTEAEIQKMQELEQAEIQRAYELGKAEQTGWIPVSERLPEDYEVILFSTKTDGVFEGRYFADDTDRQWYSFRDETFAWNNVVIAWMPLPKPYEPQESEVQE